MQAPRKRVVIAMILLIALAALGWWVLGGDSEDVPDALEQPTLIHQTSQVDDAQSLDAQSSAADQQAPSTVSRVGAAQARDGSQQSAEAEPDPLAIDSPAQLEVHVRTQAGEVAWENSVQVSLFKLPLDEEADAEDLPTPAHSKRVDERGVAEFAQVDAGEHLVVAAARNYWGSYSEITFGELREYLAADDSNSARLAIGDQLTRCNLICSVHARLRLSFTHEANVERVDLIDYPLSSLERQLSAVVYPARLGDWHQSTLVGNEGDVLIYDLIFNQTRCIVIRAVGFAPEIVELLPFGPGTTFDVGPLTLDPGKELRLRVTDTSGQAIEGASASPKTNYWYAKESLPLELPHFTQLGTSDEFGELRIEHIDHRLPSIYIFKPGYVPETFRITPDMLDAGRTYHVELELAASVRGEVLGLPEEERAGTLIALVPEGGESDVDFALPETLHQAALTTTCDESGHFEMSDVLPGVYHPCALTKAGRLMVMEAITLRSGENNGVAIFFSDGVRVSGTVTLPDGAPVAGLQIALSSDANFAWSRYGYEPTFVATTQSSGLYEFSGVLPGTWYLHLRCEFQMTDAERQRTRRVLVKREALVRNVVVEQVGATISGTITQDGEEVHLYHVELTRQQDYSSLRATWSEEFFTIHNAPAGEFLLKFMWGDPNAHGSHEAFLPLSVPARTSLIEFNHNFESAEVEVELMGATDELNPGDADPTLWLLKEAKKESSEPNRYTGGSEYFTEDWKLTLHLIQGSHYMIELECERFPGGIWYISPTQAKESKVLELPAAGGSLELTIEGIEQSEGERWEPEEDVLELGFFAKGIVEQGFWRSVSSPHAGKTYTISGVPTGEFNLLVSGWDFASQLESIRIESGKTSKLTLSIARAGTLQIAIPEALRNDNALKLTLTSRFPIHSYSPIAEPSEHSITAPFEDTAIWRSCAPGEYELRIERDGAEPSTHTITINAGVVTRFTMPEK